MRDIFLPVIKDSFAMLCENGGMSGGIIEVVLGESAHSFFCFLATTTKIAYWNYVSMESGQFGVCFLFARAFVMFCIRISPWNVFIKVKFQTTILIPMLASISYKLASFCTLVYLFPFLSFLLFISFLSFFSFLSLSFLPFCFIFAGLFS